MSVAVRSLAVIALLAIAACGAPAGTSRSELIGRANLHFRANRDSDPRYPRTNPSPGGITHAQYRSDRVAFITKRNAVRHSSTDCIAERGRDCPNRRADGARRR